MCQAYTLTYSADTLQNTFKLEVPERYIARYNARPSQLLPVITQVEPNALSFYYWGSIPSWSKNKAITEKLINSRAEQLSSIVAYQRSVESRRCIIPTDGFYAWRKISKKGVVPYRYTLKSAEPFVFAGIWDEFETEKGELAHTFSIITTPANSLLSSADSRMPAILTPELANTWLAESTEDYMKLLTPFAESKMTGYAVAPKINDPEIDLPELIDPAPPADQFGNYSLFE